MIREIQTDYGLTAVMLENDLLELVILPFKGGDIYSIVYKPANVDLLLKTPWGINPPDRGVNTSFNSEALWMDNYPGGWQLLFPNGGDACFYKGVELNFHGEASMVPWKYELREKKGEAVLYLETDLFKSPFHIEKTLSLSPGSPRVTIRETIRNDSSEMIDCMYGHHPAFGEQFIDGSCIIDTGARKIITDDVYKGSNNPLALGVESEWPYAVAKKTGATVDLSVMPPEDETRDILCYLSDFTEGWYSIASHRLGFGVRVNWPKEMFPYAWFWQEFKSSPGYPFYRRVYTSAIEPNTSIPGQGLSNVMKKTGLQKILKPFESILAEIEVELFQL